MPNLMVALPNIVNGYHIHPNGTFGHLQLNETKRNDGVYYVRPKASVGL